MISPRLSSKELSSEQKRIMRIHWEWAGGYAMFWIIVTVLIFGVVYVMLDYLGADDSVRTPSLVLLATISVINAVWRAAGLLAARIEMMLMERKDRDKFQN